MSCISAGMAAIARGRFDEALALLREALGAGGGTPNIWVVRTSIPMIVQIHHYAGRFDDANRWIQRYAPASERNAQPPAFARLYLAVLSAIQGQDGVARGELPVPPPHMPDLHSLPVTVLAAEAAVALRDRAFAERQLPAIQHLHERGMVFTSGWVTLVPRLLGALHAVTGNHDDARGLLESALAVAESSGAQTELGLSHLELAALASVVPQGRARAASHLDEARRRLTALGMRAHDRRLTEVGALLERTTAGDGRSVSDVL
jgi:hypothetical protein